MDREEHTEEKIPCTPHCPAHCAARPHCSCDDGEPEQVASFMELAEVEVGFKGDEVQLEDGHCHKICQLIVSALFLYAVTTSY